MSGNGWTEAGMFAAQMQNKHYIEQAWKDIESWKENAKSWRIYAYELENMVIEIGSRLEATCALIDGMIKAAHGDKKMQPLLDPHAKARDELLQQVQRQSKESMAQAHAARLKENPEANRKSAALKKIYFPETSERAKTAWEAVIKNRADIGSRPPTKEEFDKIQEIAKDLFVELAAVTDVAHTMIQEGQQGLAGTPESLLMDPEKRKAAMEVMREASRKAMSGRDPSVINRNLDVNNPNGAASVAVSMVAPRRR